MQDTAKNLAFLSRRVSALEKKVQSLESTVAENTVLSERLSELVGMMTNDQERMGGQVKYLMETSHKLVSGLEHNTNLGYVMTKHFSGRHDEIIDYLKAVGELLPALKQHLDNDLSIRSRGESK